MLIQAVKNNMKAKSYEEKYGKEKSYYKSPVIKSRYLNIIPKGYTKKEWEAIQAEELKKMQENQQQLVQEAVYTMPIDDNGINFDML